jgi:hypothetical protein
LSSYKRWSELYHNAVSHEIKVIVLTPFSSFSQFSIIGLQVEQYIPTILNSAFSVFNRMFHQRMLKPFIL